MDFSKVDKSFFKGKDLGLVNKVVSYLSYYDLKTDLSDFVKETSKIGLRNYSDIKLDVKFDYSTLAGRFHVLLSLIEGYYNLKNSELPDFSVNLVYFNNYNRYLQVKSENIFKIRDKNTNSRITLRFKKDPYSFLKFNSFFYH